ncbi:MAG: hypothetical protein U9N49_00980 [Campylobacterota bacterium]|nr:hypothetical protein [Campylobacterota bacterium]
MTDDGGSLGSSEDTDSFSFDVTITSNGWQVYHMNDYSNPTSPITMDSKTYSWDSTDLWYKDHTNNTILIPIKVLSSDSYAGANLTKISDGHYITNITNYLYASRVSPETPHNTTNYYDTASGTIQAKNNNFQHDKDNKLFVSIVLAQQTYSSWLNDNSANFVNAPTSNTSYALNVDNFSYADTSVKVDANNNDQGFCATTYGLGWRLPTSYEAGIDTTNPNSYKGYIPAYVGDSAADLFISTHHTDGGYIWKLKSESAYSRSVYHENDEHARCVYENF